MTQSISIARRYAKAAFGFADQAQQLPLWSDALKKLALASMDADMQRVLKDPQYTPDNYCSLLSPFTTEAPIANFVALLAEKKRLMLLPQVAQLFEKLIAEKEGLLSLTVTSAFELQESQRASIIKKLEKQFHSRVDVTFLVDTRIIGGLLMRSDNWVIDDTILGQLNRLKTALI